jgi:hypothetical protein
MWSWPIYCSAFKMAELIHPGDAQKVELLGRNRLIDELLRDNLEVAVPIRDRGIDLIAYADTAVSSYVARPIQMKAAWTQAFGINRKYEKFPGLIIAYVWNLNDHTQAVTYAMSYAEAFSIAEGMGWTRTASWARGGYSSNQPSRKLQGLLEPYKMLPRYWWLLVTRGRRLG